jgi:ribosome biogenesis GTPase
MAQQGLVTKSTGSWYSVMGADGQVIPCRMKGKIRLSGSRNTNPVAVGDIVLYEPEPGSNTGIISGIDERKNHLIRKSVNLSRHAQVIAANLDLSILVVTVVDPPTTLGFIDRFLVTCEAYSIPSVLVFNKVDLCTSEKTQALLQHYAQIYQNAGYACLSVSATTAAGLEPLKKLLSGKTTLLSGHSGVGKSTLLNALIPEATQRTAAVSDYHRKGQHTTTFAEMFPLPDQSGYIIDTPGIKGFGLVDMEEAEVDDYFPELFAVKGDCRFHNCKHLNEPGCAVKTAVEAGKIAPSRYQNYLNIIQGIDDDTHYRKDQYA